MELGRFPLFQDISEEGAACMVECFCMRRSRYGAEEVICAYDGAGGEVGVVLEGAARLVRVDREGNQAILEHLREGNIFGEPLSAWEGDSVSVVCEKGCAVLYINYARMMTPCQRACPHHSRLIRNLFALAAGQIRQLNHRLEVLSQRSIREKLLCYFAIQSRAAGGGGFTLPFTLSALADYICTDRSAMMRELRKLREAGVVRIEGRHVTLPGRRP